MKALSVIHKQFIGESTAVFEVARRDYLMQVKESKISRYTRQYELFQMEQNESVYSMYSRFTDLVNTLENPGNTFSNSEKVMKIIRSLPKEWRQ